MSVLRGANDGLAFLLELAALVALGLWGFTTDTNLPVRILLGLGAPVAFAVLWGFWLAPRADHRLDMPWLLLAKLALFAVATAALAVAGHPRPAAALGGLAVLNLALATAWGTI